MLKNSYEKYEALVKKRGLNNAQVSKETGIPKSCIQDWKTGRSTPKLEKFLKLAEYFGVSVSYFVE